jgi:hypothetical protein
MALKAVFGWRGAGGVDTLVDLEANSQCNNFDGVGGI